VAGIILRPTGAGAYGGGTYDTDMQSGNAVRGRGAEWIVAHSENVARQCFRPITPVRLE